MNRASVPLNPDMVAMAAFHGAFVMGDEDGSVQFYLSHERGILPIDGIHLSRSLRRRIRRGEYEITFDRAFERVMRACRRPDDNWINEPIIAVYQEIHQQGWAHSCEAWNDGELVGGLYGIAVGQCFFAESMFHRRTDAGKVALWALVERCRNLGFRMVDTQTTTEHLETLGQVGLSHHEFMGRLTPLLSQPTAWSRTFFETQ